MARPRRAFRRQQSDIALVELVAPAPTAPQPLSASVPAEGSPIAALGYGTTPGAGCFPMS